MLSVLASVLQPLDTQGILSALRPAGDDVAAPVNSFDSFYTGKW